MVNTIADYDAMAIATRRIPLLQQTTFKLAPPPILKDNHSFGGNHLYLWYLTGTGTILFSGHAGSTKLERLDIPTSKWRRYHESMKYLRKALRIHLAERPLRRRDTFDDRLPEPDRDKVCFAVPVRYMSGVRRYYSGRLLSCNVFPSSWSPHKDSMASSMQRFSRTRAQDVCVC